MLIEMFKLRQKSSRRNAKRKTLQIDGAEKYTSARHACSPCVVFLKAWGKLWCYNTDATEQCTQSRSLNFKTQLKREKPLTRRYLKRV